MPKNKNEKLLRAGAKGKPAALPQALDNTLKVSDDATGKADQKLSVSSLLANDKGGQAKSLHSIESLGLGPVSLSKEGKEILYDTNGAFDYLAVGETATHTFEYTIQMGKGVLRTATVTVTGENDGLQAKASCI